MKKIILITFEVLLLLVISFTQARAESIACSSASRKNFQFSLVAPDNRITVLQNYLLKHNSPLITYAPLIIEKSDQYKLFDWRLITAIAGVESTFGKHIPVNSYNAWGIANGNYYFSSWEEAIDYVSNLLKTKYVDKGLNSIDKIAPVYAPPSRTWSYKVKYFIREIALNQRTQIEDLNLN